MLTSINAFEVFPVFKKKILILGDMLEQGEKKYRNHEIIIERVNAIPESVIETVYYVGEAFNYNSSKNKRNNVFFASSFVEISDQVSELLNKKYCVFFKSSRAMLFFNYVSDYLQKINKE
jgi:UDP-N-acetylmuramyl pentapeptide synthase